MIIEKKSQNISKTMYVFGNNAINLRKFFISNKLLLILGKFLHESHKFNFK